MIKSLVPIILGLSVSVNATDIDDIATETRCVDGYQFLLVYAKSGSARPPSVVQIFQSGSFNDKPPQPIKCTVSGKYTTSYLTTPMVIK